MLKLLSKNKIFRLFWFANTLSTIGDFVDDIAFAQIVYLITKSTLLTSYVFAIKVAMTFFSVLTATYVDRHRKKPILCICSFGQAIILLLFLICFKLNKLSAGIFMLFATVQSLFSSFSVPASNSFISYVVDKEDLINARSIMNIVLQILQVLAYAFAGFLISSLGVEGAIILDIFTFLIAGILIIRLREPDYELSLKEESNTFFEDLGAGLSFVLNSKIILGILIVTFIGNAATAPVDSLMPAYFENENLTTNMYAVFMASIATGSIIGSWLVGKVRKFMNLQDVYSLGFLFGAIGFVCIIQNKIVMIIIGALLLGLSMGDISVLTSTILLYFSPRDKVARVFSIFKAFTYIASPLGILLAGVAGEFVKIKWIILGLSVLLFTASALSNVIVKNAKTVQQ